ncbi:hypothetical protein LY71_12546 [Geodermatophilus tzadiensis]|uniref:Uncharacterized protein n=1 Tax=Geodermatophilus tzadiensis TaxID=1137988 RepID=A0A2T0ST85_9ACTN|nr:hypothetical protein [Geodermatophilus tzadiensis]PRY36625.1 hypothetical protein LY71_12546 [Geodermatophilus tzadiensis]
MALDVLAVDEAAIGGLYSQLTGVLAGFAFAGLALVITQRLTSDPDEHQDEVEETDNSALLLFAAFLGLALCSLGYAVLGGEENRNLATVEHVVMGVGFTSAGLLMLLALREVVSVAPRT